MTKRARSTRTAAGRRNPSAGREPNPLVPFEGGPGGIEPRGLPVLPLRSDVVFPQTVVPLVVNRLPGIRLIDEVHGGGGERLVALATQLDPDTEDPALADLHPVVCVASLLKMLKFPDGSTRIVCQGLGRARLKKLVRGAPFLLGRVEPIEEVNEEGDELDALAHFITGQFNRLSEQVPEELQVAAMNTREPARLADLLGSSLPFTLEEKAALLAEANVRKRLRMLGQMLSRHLNVMELSTKIQEQVGSEISKAQREHFLRQQIKAIQEELGEMEPDSAEGRDLDQRLKKAKLPPDARAEAKREIDRLAGMHPSSAEFSIVRTYVEWLIGLPWSKSSVDHLDLKDARQILDDDHYNLKKIKERILEYLAVRKLKRDMKGPILCFVGPPGTGKTSLGRSIARAMGRQFVRMSLGGVHDEAEIRGHRRTYVAAMPGRIIQGLKKAGTNNPVFMLDEVDKVGADFRGDPAAALLEVLDPEQNSTFRDNYLDLDFDLSKVMFIATANVLETIPSPLLDRMEILELPGYSDEEKVLIAQRFLIPKQLEGHGLTPPQLAIDDPALRRVISEYTREAGLRNLEREVATICRKAARRRAEGDKRKVRVTDSDVPQYLGPPKHFREVAARTGVPGVATGMAWTPTGGEILFIEATGMPGKGNLMLTGLLGDSMKESAQAAMSYLRSHSDALGIDPARFGKTDVHVHVPAGAVPKDGPSAGVAIAAALISLFRDQPIQRDLSMTGELTLTGRVLPVGGVKEKALGARRAGIRRILLPRHNEKDLEDLPAEVRADLAFGFVDTLDEVVAQLFPKPGTRKPRRGPAGRRAKLADPPGVGTDATRIDPGPGPRKTVIRPPAQEPRRPLP